MQSIDMRYFDGQFEVFVEHADGNFTVTVFETKADAKLFIEKIKTKPSIRQPELVAQ